MRRRLALALAYLALASTAACAGGSAYPTAAAPAYPPQGYAAKALGHAEASDAKKDMAPALPGGAPGAAPAPAAIAAIPQADPDENAARDPSLVVYAAKLALAVYQVEPSLAAVEKLAREHGGFLASKQDREIVVRVPRARFQQALAGIDKVGDVIHRDISAVDVTEEHVDLEIRIKNARAMQARLKELLAKATVKEAIEIERELGRITGELESLEGKLKVLRDRVAYSTISVTFQERAPSAAARPPQLPFPWLATLGLPSLLSLSEEKK
jgi:hypothetical protein